MRTFLLAVLTAFSSLAFAQSSDYVWGVKSGTNAYAVGLSQLSGYTLYAFVKVPAEVSTMVQGAQITSVDVCLGNVNLTSADFRLIATHDPASGPGAFIRNEAATPRTGTSSTCVWSNLVFSNPITLEAGKDYFIGFCATIPSAGVYALGVVETGLRPGINDVCYVTYQGSYQKLSLDGIAHAMGIHISGDLPDLYDVGITSAEIPSYIPLGTNLELPITVANNGTKNVISFDVLYTVGKEKGSVHISTALMKGSSKQVTVRIPGAPELLGDHEITLELTDINETEKDAIPDDNMCSAWAAIYDPAHIAKRHALLVESFTGQNCGYCPSGHVRTHDAINLLGEQNAAWVCHHAGHSNDAFTTAVDRSYTWFYNASSTYAPAFMMDRSLYDGLTTTVVQNPLAYSTASSLAAQMKELLALPALVELSATANYDAAKGLFTVQVDAERLCELRANGTKVCMNVFAVENGLIAFQQSGGNNYEHNKVFRAALTPTWGETINWSADGTFSKTYTLDISKKTWKGDNMELIAFVSYYNSKDPLACPVLNTVRVPINDPEANSISHVTSAPQASKIYNLQGVEVHRPQRGIYIRDGKKIVVR